MGKITQKEIDLKCCGNCGWCLDCGMDHPWRICVDWKSDNNTRKDRRNEKQMLEKMQQQQQKLNQILKG